MKSSSSASNARPALVTKATYGFKPGPRKVARPPCRSFREMCEELGVPPRVMSAKLMHYKGPTAKLNHSSGNRVHANHWYDPVEFRRWWAGLTEEQRRG